MNREKLRREIARLRSLLPTASPESAVVMKARIEAKFEQLYDKPSTPKVDEVVKELPLTNELSADEEPAEEPKPKKKRKVRKKKQPEVDES